MALVWHWIRHGPTHDPALLGWRDAPADLSDTAALARVSAALPRDALVVSSDLARARATADALADGRRRLPDRPGLREFHFGRWDGLAGREAAARHPETSRAYWRDPGHPAPPGGESWHQAAARINAVVDDLAARHADAHIVAVAHIGVILTQVARATGRAPAEVIGESVDNLSLTRIRAAPGGWELELLNHAP